nr:very short patch repair endonuclease [Variovorax sp. CF313]
MPSNLPPTSDSSPLPPTAARSALMGRIRSVDTKPELVVRRMLHRLGYRYVLHDKRLPGKPDLVFPLRKAVIFVDGCFWHGHDCRLGSKPKTNAAFWQNKILGNKRRDMRHRRTLRKLGWRVATVWECSTRLGDLSRLERRLVRFLEAPRSLERKQGEVV